MELDRSYTEKGGWQRLYNNIGVAASKEKKEQEAEPRPHGVGQLKGKGKPLDGRLQDLEHRKSRSKRSSGLERKCEGLKRPLAWREVK